MTTNHDYLKKDIVAQRLMRILRIFCNEKLSHDSDSDHEIDSLYRLHTSEYFAATQIICKHEKTCTNYPRIFTVFL